jgi:hypothetical protein
VPELWRRLRPAADSAIEELEGRNFLIADPASPRITYKPVDPAGHATFSARIRRIPPEKR